MRYSFALSTIIACTLGSKAYGFATRAAPSAARIAPTSYRAVDAASFSSTSINLFGFGKTVDAPTSTDITEKEVRALFELWNSALATGDSRIVASRYIKVRYGLSLIRITLMQCISHINKMYRYKSIILLQSPVLLPTVSDKPRTDYDSVKDYFDGFLLKKPQGKNLVTFVSSAISSLDFIPCRSSLFSISRQNY
jgi:hypothetical protein